MSAWIRFLNGSWKPCGRALGSHGISDEAENALWAGVGTGPAVRAPAELDPSVVTVVRPISGPPPVEGSAASPMFKSRRRPVDPAPLAVRRVVVPDGRTLDAAVHCGGGVVAGEPALVLRTSTVVHRAAPDERRGPWSFFTVDLHEIIGSGDEYVRVLVEDRGVERPVQYAHTDAGDAPTRAAPADALSDWFEAKRDADGFLVLEPRRARSVVVQQIRSIAQGIEIDLAGAPVERLIVRRRRDRELREFGVSDGRAVIHFDSLDGWEHTPHYWDVAARVCEGEGRLVGVEANNSDIIDYGRAINIPTLITQHGDGAHDWYAKPYFTSRRTLAIRTGLRRSDSREPEEMSENHNEDDGSAR